MIKTEIPSTSTVTIIILQAYWNISQSNSISGNAILLQKYEIGYFDTSKIVDVNGIKYYIGHDRKINVETYCYPRHNATILELLNYINKVVLF